EGAEIVRVILGPGPRLVQDLSSGGNRGLAERLDDSPGGGGEGDVGLPEALACLALTDPELPPVYAVAEGLAEVHQPGPAKRRQHRIVEGGAGRDVGTLHGEVIDHGIILLYLPVRNFTIAAANARAR